jgi:1,4-alpha-glucan branching enzyme
MQDFVRQLNQRYRQYPALYQRDGQKDGFVWSEYKMANQGIVAFIRKTNSPHEPIILSVSNFSDQPQHHCVLGVPQSGRWQLILDSQQQQQDHHIQLQTHPTPTTTHPCHLVVDMPAACTRWFMHSPQAQ